LFENAFLAFFARVFHCNFLKMKQIPFLIALWALGFFACQSDANKPSEAAQSASPATTLVSAKKVIVFFGNSLTAAYQLSPEQGFPALIQQKIDSLGLPYTCVNAGLSGETTADGANRIEWVLQQPMDIFVLELGGNDALRGLPIDASRKNLQTIVGKVKAARPDCKIVVAGMLAPPNLGATYTNAFRGMFSELAEKEGAALIPFLLEGVGGVPALNLEDGIHPNVEGQKIVAENVWSVLRPIL
jgi:acyl-CoA thioesterase-1